MWASQFNGLNDSRQNVNMLNQSASSATLSMPPGSSEHSIQPSYASSFAQSAQQSSFGLDAQFQQQSFGSETQLQQQSARKYEIGF